MATMTQLERSLIDFPRVRAAMEHADDVQHLRRMPPRQLEIQPTARCHRTCAFCSHLLRNQRGGELSGGLVEAILEHAKDLGCERVCYSGGGEPLIWEEGNLANAIAQARNFAQVTLTTSGDQFWDDSANGLSRLAREVLPLCHALLLNIPEVSDAGILRQIADGPSWERTRRMLQDLLRWRDREGFAMLATCVVVVNRSNVGSVAEIDRTFQELGVDRIYYKQFKLFESGRPGNLRADAPTVLAALDGNGREAWSPGLTQFVAYLGEQANESNLRATSPCWINQLGFSVIVDPLGEVYLCTPTVGDRTHSIGNVHEASLQDCWTSDRRRQVVEELSARSGSGACPAECRYHPHNRIIDRHVHGDSHSMVEMAAAEIPNAGLEDVI
jgi:radical SAM protein with 4Fe4S-binding SPASM domain